MKGLQNPGSLEGLNVWGTCKDRFFAAGDSQRLDISVTPIAIKALDRRRQPDDGGLDRLQIGVDLDGVVAAPHVAAQELNPAHEDRQGCAQIVHLHRSLLLLLGSRLELRHRLVHG